MIVDPLDDEDDDDEDDDDDDDDESSLMNLILSELSLKPKNVRTPVLLELLDGTLSVSDDEYELELESSSSSLE